MLETIKTKNGLSTELTPVHQISTMFLDVRQGFKAFASNNRQLQVKCKLSHLHNSFRFGVEILGGWHAQWTTKVCAEA